MAEGMRFELTKQIDPFNRFPGDRLQPLGHPSAGRLKWAELGGPGGGFGGGWVRAISATR